MSDLPEVTEEELAKWERKGRVRETTVLYDRWILGAAYFPYQSALGVSVRVAEFTGLRLYIGPFKLWLSRLKEAE